MRAIRVKGTVLKNDIIEIHLPESLPPGTETDILVLYEPTAEEQRDVVPLASLIGAAKGMSMSAEEAAEFVSRERDRWDERLQLP